jgi:hypothetical protein
VNRFLITSVVTSIVFLGSFAAQARELAEQYDLGGVSEEQFQKDVAECENAPINSQDIPLYVIAPTALLPYYRSQFCMAKKGYHHSTKPYVGPVADCEKENGQWDSNAQICELPETASSDRRRTETEYLENLSRSQCQELNGEWETGSRSCEVRTTNSAPTKAASVEPADPTSTSAGSIEEAKLTAATRPQCQELNGFWHVSTNTCF